MGEKLDRIILKPILLLIGIISFSNNAFAKTPDIIPEAVTNFLRWLFINLPEGLRRGSDPVVSYFKFLIFILMFAILNYGSKKVLKDNNRVSGTVAFVLALISTVLIPKKFIIFLVSEYSAVTAIFLIFLPGIIGIMIIRKIPKEDRIPRIILIILIGLIALFVGAFLAENAKFAMGDGAKLYKSTGQFAQLGGFVALIVGFFSLFTGSSRGGDVYLILLFNLIIVSQSVSAKIDDIVPDIVKDILEWVFVRLPIEASGGTKTFVIFAKFLIFMLMYFLLQWGGTKVFGQENSRVSGSIAFILGLFSAILIPSKFLVFIFSEYSIVTSILLAFLPLFVLLKIRRQMGDQPWYITLFVTAVIIIITYWVGMYFVDIGMATGGSQGQGLTTFGQYMQFGAVFGGIISLISGAAFGGTIGINREEAERTDRTGRAAAAQQDRAGQADNQARRELDRGQDLANRIRREAVAEIQNDEQLRRAFDQMRNLIAGYQRVLEDIQNRVNQGQSIEVFNPILRQIVGQLEEFYNRIIEYYQRQRQGG